MLSFDLLIPSHGGFHPIIPLIESIARQMIRPARVIILVRKECSVVDLQQFADAIHSIIDPIGSELIIQHAFYSDHQQGRGVGYDRSFLVKQATSPYLCMIDQDNVLPPGQLDAWISSYEEVVAELGHDAIISPTIMREGKIQSQGITGFSYLFPKYTFGRCGNKLRHEVKMLGANSLFGPTELFQQIQFDPHFVGSYEDIDFSSRVVQSGYSVVVLRDVHIDHQESKKSFLGELFLANPTSAYLRSKNRILRVRKTATVRQKIQYFCLGLWLQTFGRIRYISRSHVRHKAALITAIFRGIVSGMTQRLS